MALRFGTRTSAVMEINHTPVSLEKPFSNLDLNDLTKTANSTASCSRLVKMDAFRERFYDAAESH